MKKGGIPRPLIILIAAAAFLWGGCGSAEQADIPETSAVSSVETSDSAIEDTINYDLRTVNVMNQNVNPIIPLDYPDPDVIRVGDTYYMITTTMHFFPCCEILRSYDLVNWEHAAYICDELDGTHEQKLEIKNIYGKGMWAATLRYHEGKFYAAFVCNDTHKTYLYTAEDIYGKWEKSEISGFYHDCSLLFDDDGKIYIVYGNKEIWLTELEDDLSGPKKDGLHRRIAFDENNNNLGYEGSHFYKINGRYYLFLIHSKSDRWLRCEACLSSDSLEGGFTGGDCFTDTIGYCGQGVAQGGIVDTPDGKWFSVMFQDRGAAGRMPVIVPVRFEGDTPIFGDNGTMPESFDITSSRPDHEYAPLVSPDDFTGSEMLPCWQFNHQPDSEFYEYGGGRFRITSKGTCSSVLKARNTLTQRMTFPRCETEVTVDASGLGEGDCAGLCAFQGCYAWIGVSVRDGVKRITMQSLSGGDISEEYAELPGDTVRVGISADFENMKDTAQLYYYGDDGEKKQLGGDHKLYFRLDHFTGCRAALFMYSEGEAGGFADFSDFDIRQ